jgi:FkbM family methyltransferase
MIEFREGWWWPQGDQGGWQASHGNLPDLARAVDYCKQKRQVVQAGSLGGVWPKYLTSLFEEVFTFEPDPINYECTRRNLEGIKNVVAYHCALGAASGGTVGLAEYAPDNRGAGYVNGFGAIDLFAGDDLNLSRVDLIVLDVEGYEAAALRGLARTVRNSFPVVMLEHKHWQRYGEDPVEYLKSLGYSIATTVNRDVIMVPNG